jgi:DNA polymerase III subunit epsilon
MRDFIALDVETANEDYSSICSIGYAEFINGRIHNKWSQLINPEDEFDSHNVEIHGINEIDVEGKPTFPEVYGQLTRALNGKIVVYHNGFDRAALKQVCDKYSLEHFLPYWLDTALVVKRTWPQFQSKGYGLKNITRFLGIEFKHHDALEDAIATGKVLIAAMGHSGLTEQEWVKRAKQPITPTVTSKEGNPEGPMWGETIVFTGACFSPRRDLISLASSLGCAVKGSVTKKTTILVVGLQDLKKLKGKTKSSKQIKAEDSVKKGQEIRIISENGILALWSQYTD